MVERKPEPDGYIEVEKFDPKRKPVRSNPGNIGPENIDAMIGEKNYKTDDLEFYFLYFLVLIIFILIFYFIFK